MSVHLFFGVLREVDNETSLQPGSICCCTVAVSTAGPDYYRNKPTSTLCATIKGRHPLGGTHWKTSYSSLRYAASGTPSAQTQHTVDLSTRGDRKQNCKKECGRTQDPGQTERMARPRKGPLSDRVGAVHATLPKRKTHQIFVEAWQDEVPRRLGDNVEGDSRPRPRLGCA